MESDTTILVTKALHDRVDAAARAQGATIDAFLDRLLDGYDRDRRMAMAASAVRSSAPEALAAYRRELEPWDAADADGLAGT